MHMSLHFVVFARMLEHIQLSIYLPIYIYTYKRMYIYIYILYLCMLLSVAVGGMDGMYVKRDALDLLTLFVYVVVALGGLR
jgi:hypothetical protein